MGAGQQELQKPRAIVQSWTAQDWQCARSLAPAVEVTLRKACQLHQKVSVFDTHGALGPTLRSRLDRLRAPTLALALAPVLAALELRLEKLQVELEPAQALERLAAEPDVGPGLAHLAACRLSFPPEFRGEFNETAADCATEPQSDSTEGDPASDDAIRLLSGLFHVPQGIDPDPISHAPDPLSDTTAQQLKAKTESGPAGQRLREQLDDLDSQHGEVVEAATRVLDNIRSGRMASDEPMLVLLGWNEDFRQAATAAGTDVAQASTASLRLAMEAIEATKAAGLRQQQLAERIRTLVGACPSVGAELVLRPVLDAIGELDPAQLADDTAQAHGALERLLTTPASEVLEEDADLIAAVFGARVMFAAVGEVLTFGPTPKVALTEPELAPAVTPVAPAAAAVPVAPVEPAESTGEPVTESRDLEVPSATGAGAQFAPPASPAVRVEPRPEVVVAEAAVAQVDRLQPVRPEPTAPHNDEPTQARELLAPHVAEAILKGRPSLAYWYSVALGEGPEVQSILEVLALTDAITADGDDTAMRIRALLQNFDIASISGDASLLKMAASALARAALRMPFSPATTLLDDACVLLGDDQPPFLDAIRQAAARGVELKSLQDQNRKSLPELIAARDLALGALRDYMTDAPQRRMRMARASNIWRHLLVAKGPLGRAVSRTLAKPHDLTSAEDLLADLQDTKDLDKMLDDLDARLHPIAARKSKIIAGARTDLREHTGALLAVLREHVEAEKAVTSREHQHSYNEAPEALELLAQAVSAEADVVDEDPTDPGTSSLLATKDWVHEVLQRRVELPCHAVAPGHALARELTFSFEVDRDSDGSIIASSVTMEALQALQEREPEKAYDGFVARDDHLGVEQLLDALRARGQQQLADKLAERQREDVKVSNERLRILIDDTDRTLSRALSTALLSESESTLLRADVERLRADLANDFVAARRELQQIIDRVRAAQAQALEQACQQLRDSSAPAKVKARISKLLDDGDLVNAQEFLSQVSAGAQELPDEAAADATLGQFWPAFTQAAERASQVGQPELAELDWLLELAEGGLEVAGRTVLPPDASPLIAQGVQSWASLARDKRAKGHLDHLKAVLGLLGLEVRGSFDQKDKGRRLRWWTVCQADRVGQALVPAYGSASNDRYQVLLCWDRLSADRLLDLVEERPTSSPTIVLYFHTLPMRERRALANRSRPHNKNVSTVVIDHATIAFLATSHDIALQTALGISLPFTSINPYTPFALGDVPREVFYGRKEELRRVQDPNDALFVYGGRQLGKSALLKTALQEFRDGDPRWRSIYVDLKAEGVGEWRQPDDIWQVLLPQLIEAEIIEKKVTAKAPPQVIVASIRRWLDEDKDRRFLLLLDEADAFLETDARARVDTLGEARFVNVYQLKGLMDGTGRRFKPVFAGLHQVQRFHTTSNGPMAHVGAEIPIGPLPPAEAFKLVVKPLAAIGFQFETPDAAWRLLNYTNYQASLIQLFCDALVKRLHRRGLTAGAPPTLISGDLIDEVYADKTLRDQIAQRFDWTINLDSRYRVIAYTTAWLSLNGTTQLFPPVTLYDECATFWPSGFSELSLDTFVAYLDELVGLGVLVRTPGDDYGIRSPNVIRLLGSPEEIERRLEESDKLELSRPFDPARYRRALQGDPNTRSPLSELQAKQVLDTGAVVHLIVGTSALGLDRVAQALIEAGGDEVTVHVCSTTTLANTLTALARRVGRHHVIVDDPTASEAQAVAALTRLFRQVTNRERLTASWLTPVGATWYEAAQLDSDLSLQRTVLQPWTDDALQAWAPECGYPLGSTKDRAELLEATGGWPQVIEAAAAAARTGMPAARAREQAAEMVCGDEQTTRFFISIGLRADPEADRVAEVISSWSDEIYFNDLSELVDIAERELLPVVDRLVDRAVLRRSASGDSYRLNSLVARLLQPGQ